MVFWALELECLVKGLLALDVAVRVRLLLLGWRAAIVGGRLVVLWVWGLLIAVVAIVVTHRVLLLGLPVAIIVVVVCLAVMRHVQRAIDVMG